MLLARESRPPYDHRCDFKFKSYTFNAGVATLGDLNLSIFNHTNKVYFQCMSMIKLFIKIQASCASQDYRNQNCALNTFGERLKGYLKIAINRWRSNPEENRLTKVSEIRKMMVKNEDRMDSPWNDLLRCKKTPQV